MKKLKTVLHYNYLYIILIITTSLYSFIYLNLFKPETKLEPNQTKIVGVIINIKISSNLLTLEVKEKEKVIGYYYFKTEEEMNIFEKNYELGDTILLKGTLTKPTNNTVPNLFNYKKYLERKNIFYQMNIETYQKLKENSNPLYFIKNAMINHINTYQTKDYLHTFILGNNDLLNQETNTNYQEIGISHLLAISGMHISLLSSMILFLLKKLKIGENKGYIITILFLFLFMFLSGNSPSVSRSVILFSLLTLNKILKLNIKTLNILIIVFCILVIGNPNILFDIGFQFSFIVSFYLILIQDKMKNDNYIKSLLKVSVISFLVSLPISIYYFYQVNILSIIFNLIFVPLVSIIIFPFSLITFLIPMLDPILKVLINIIEDLTDICNQIPTGKLIFGRPSIIWILIYYVLITLFLYKGKKMCLFLTVILLITQYLNLVIFSKSFLIVIDIGQGDSSLIYHNNKTTLIDTGGKIALNQEKWKQRQTKSLADKTQIPLLKSIGIKKINNLVLTHGDFDHMGEAINLVNNFKVEKVIFNCGEFNELEQELIKELDKRKIPYYSCIKELNIDDNKLYFLNNKDYGNENDNSSVIYTELNNHKFLFMGDAGIEVEEDLIEKYNLKNIDVLKVGHHGSKTSSSKNFIYEIEPKYSIISVGKNNRYGHPNDNVLENLEGTIIYRTDIDGSVMFEIKKNKLEVETCTP